MKPASFEYVRPRDLSEAVDMLARSGGAKLLAGGQSLGPMLNLRLARPDILVDISRLDALKRIEETRMIWRIGAGVTHADLEDTDGLHGAKMIGEVAAGIAYRSVRNRGTIGGSLAHADPAADWPLALAALNATVIVRGPKGRTRRVPVDEFMLSAFLTVLQHDELIESVEVPKQPSPARFGYFKFCRKTGEFPEASAAVLFDQNANGSRIFVGSLDGAPQPLPELARAIGKQGPSAATDHAVKAAIAAAVPEFDEIDLRMHAAGVQHAVRRAFKP